MGYIIHERLKKTIYMKIYISKGSKGDNSLKKKKAV
jgi:hypothetical protein